MEKHGTIYRVAGPVVTATGISPRMYDVMLVGEEGLMGEVIKIDGDKTIIQVYEETSGLKPGEKVIDTHHPLVAELGPGLLSSVYDGIQRPLPVLMESMGDFIKRGVSANGLDRSKKWKFVPVVKKGDKVEGGDVLGTVQEFYLTHKIMVHPGISGTVEEIREGEFTVEETVAKVAGKDIMMMQKWPVRMGRPFGKKLLPDIPLITGQRVLDTMFPLPKGGTAAIPGAFGTGKTVTQQQLAKWSDAEIVVYIGCGERGNEMTEVLATFPELEDPKTGEPLMQRTVLIANTSNMPVAAREASVYTGMTIAEYYRDQGYNVSLMADSTSRWAEAMREISSRLEEMPGEEGFPAYLSARLSEFYERAGRVQNRNGTVGSISVVGAVSPPGGDLSEPVTQNTLRIVRVFWALDSKLRERRHFPTINWLTSYSLYTTGLNGWYKENVADDFPALRQWAMEILQRESELQEIVQLVGSDALPDEQKMTLEVARMIREIFLQQNAYHKVDTYCPLPRQYTMLKVIKKFADLSIRAVEGGVAVDDIVAMPIRNRLAKSKYEETIDSELEAIDKEMAEAFDSLGGKA
ncbi:MAG: V-type ATP synthase subunit A [Methanomassiliicoccaceae archaeon]|jgi:V/A-type H+-transporting ATPase subunit A|nr:V-type ATP synthase subunit A [Euryarchaeota archaeon]HOB38475.1 V-type ATP synthase subunit A [Methanomassiliicoccaceae archaeon]HOL06733.1 V-type ATP synthase subunit A [Methanomassiliicoccaceae archaeon]HOQ25413.1 V-type ATP synthase subunit A [Methanomassiliicoccaceae archaeon]HQA21685.1 V-type ATP synthase subunit A [Methanomassiliicoccaceae archaeon]